MRLRERLVRVGVAAVGAAVVSWPLAGFTATEREGARFSILPSLEIGLLVLGLGVGYALVLSAWGLVPRSAVAAASAAARRPAVSLSSAGALLAFLAVLPLFASGAWTSNLVDTLVFATIALGLNISMGMAGLLVLGHAAFWAAGAYTFTMLVVHLHWNFWLAFPAAGGAAALAGFLLGLPALRLRGDYLAIVTLGFGESFRWFLKNEAGLTGGDAGIPGSEVPGTVLEPQGWLGTWLWQPTTMNGCYWFSLGLLVVCVICVALYSRSRFGRALFALREDETAAKCMGIDTVRVKLLAFTASAFWAGLAGVVHPVFRGQITPQMFDFNASVLFVAMVVLGGLGSIPGSILGAAILFLLPQVLRDKLPAIQEYRMLIFGAILAAMMVVKPEGLFGPGHRAEEHEGEGGGDAGAPAPAAGPAGGGA
jgi:branched-chain amino acid transport system permease protein